MSRVIDILIRRTPFIKKYIGRIYVPSIKHLKYGLLGVVKCFPCLVEQNYYQEFNI